MIETAITSDAEQPKKVERTDWPRSSWADVAERAEEEWEARETVELASKTEECSTATRLAMTAACPGRWRVVCAARCLERIAQWRRVVVESATITNPSGTPPPAWLGNREERAKCLKKLQKKRSCVRLRTRRWRADDGCLILTMDRPAGGPSILA